MIDRLAGGRRSPKADGDALHALDGLLDHGGELGWGSPARMAKDISLTAVSPPNIFLMPSTFRTSLPAEGWRRCRESDVWRQRRG